MSLKSVLTLWIVAMQSKTDASHRGIGPTGATPFPTSERGTGASGMPTEPFSPTGPTGNFPFPTSGTGPGAWGTSTQYPSTTGPWGTSTQYPSTTGPWGRSTQYPSTAGPWGTSTKYPSTAGPWGTATQYPSTAGPWGTATQYSSTTGPLGTSTQYTSTTGPWGTSTQYPSTATVEVVTTPAVVCDSNCGSLNQGGGTCKKSGGCTSCNLNKVLVKGRVANKYSGYCAKKVYCQAGSVILSAKAGRPCGCADSRCQYCIRTADTETCKKCNNGFYLLNDRCVETCPSTLTSSGIQNVGRKCLSSFTCKNNKEVEFGTKCKCAAIGNVGGANCHTCEFEAGQYGQKCTRCSENKFLNPNTHVCVDNCDGLDDVVSYQVGVYGSACRAPFTCAKGLDEAGEKCKCPKSIGGSKCIKCTWDIVDGTTTATCLKP